MSQPDSDRLSVVDIKTKEFKKTPLGYSPREVVEYLDHVAKALGEMQGMIEKQKEELHKWRSRESELEKLKESALKEAEMIRDNANAEKQRVLQELDLRVAQVRKETEEWLAEVIAEVEETERQRNNFVTAFRSALESHAELLKKNEETASTLGNRLGRFLHKTEGAEIGNAAISKRSLSDEKFGAH